MVRCDRCGKQFSRAVSAYMLRFEDGKYVCPECHKQNKRFISAFDLSLYLTGIVAMSGVMLTLQLFATKLFDNFLSGMIIVVAAVILLYTVLTKWGHIIYNDAPYKKDWKNIVIKEDSVKVHKTLTYYFFGYLIVAVFLAPVMIILELQWLYPVLIMLFVFFLAWRTRQLYDKEKAYAASLNKAK